MTMLMDWDRQLFLWLNGFNSPWLDPAMLLLTKTGVWIPLYLFLAFLIFKNYKMEGWLVLAGVALAILLADRITTGIMKPYFSRLRPSHDPALQNLIHIVGDYRGGLHGFASSHAANTSAVALLIWLAFKDIYKQMWLIFIWAAFMSYTRIYLGVHYPGDIVVGILVGLICGWLGFRFYRWLKNQRNKKLAQQPPL